MNKCIKRAGLARSIGHYEKRQSITRLYQKLAAKSALCSSIQALGPVLPSACCCNQQPPTCGASTLQDALPARRRAGALHLLRGLYRNAQLQRPARWPFAETPARLPRVPARCPYSLYRRIWCARKTLRCVPTAELAAAQAGIKLQRSHGRRIRQAIGWPPTQDRGFHRSRSLPAPVGVHTFNPLQQTRGRLPIGIAPHSPASYSKGCNM